MTEDVALGHQVRRGLGWSLANNVISKLGTIVMGIILARLLDPADYGKFTVAIVALMIIANLNDLGLEPTVVRWPGSIDKIIPTAFTTIFASSCLLFAFVCVAAGPFAAAMNAPDAANIVRLLGLGVVINGLFAVPSAVLTRTFRQDLRTAADACGFAASLVITISLAATGHGPWSLAWGRLAGNAVTSVMHGIFAHTRVRPGWSTSIAKALLSQGLPIAGTLLLATVMINLDYMVVGRVLGPVAVGFYLMAFNLSTSPVTLFSTAVANVALPGFAHLQDRLSELRDAFVRSLSYLMWVTIPVAVGLCIGAVPLITIVYGPRWTPAAQALRFLAIVGLIRVALQLAADLLVAVGRSRTTMWLQGLWLAALLPALVIGVHLRGIQGVGIAHLVVAGGIMVPAYLVAVRAVGLHTRDVGGPLVAPLLGGAVAIAVGLAVVPQIDSPEAAIVVTGMLALAGPLIPVAPHLRQLAIDATAGLSARRRLRSAQASGEEPEEPEVTAVDAVLSGELVPKA